MKRDPHDYYIQWACERIRKDGFRVRSLVNPKLLGHALAVEMPIGDCLVMLDDGQSPCIEFAVNWERV